MPPKTNSPRDEQIQLAELLRSISDVLTEQSNVLKNLGRPYIAVDLIPRHFVNFLNLRIRNVGHTPAYGIHLSVEPSFEIREKKFDELQVFQRPISILAPQDELTFFFESAVVLFSNPEGILKFTVKASYKNADGEQFTDEFLIDPEILRGLAVELPSSDKITEELEEIKKELEDIARYANELRNQDFMRRYQESRAEPGTEDAVETDAD